MTRAQRTVLQSQLAAIGPRVPGGRYSLMGDNLWYEVQYDDIVGLSTHATPWHEGDRVISQPDN